MSHVHDDRSEASRGSTDPTSKTSSKGTLVIALLLVAGLVLLIALNMR